MSVLAAFGSVRCPLKMYELHMWGLQHNLVMLEAGYCAQQSLSKFTCFLEERPRSQV